jgi:hypothetical protein
MLGKEIHPVAFVDPWWAIVRTAESSTARESRLLVHFSKAPINLLNGTLPATTCLRKMAWGFEQIYSRVSPYLRSLYPSIATVVRFRTWASIPS